MSIKAGPTPAVVLECRNEGADLVVPNVALLSWLEQQTGQPIGDLFNDETGERPWSEIVDIAQRVAKLVQVDLPAGFLGDTMPDDFFASARAAQRRGRQWARPRLFGCRRRAVPNGQSRFIA